MYSRGLWPATCLLAFCTCTFAPSVAVAQPPPDKVQQLRDELDRLRREFDAMRQTYDDRLAQIERQLQQLGASTAPDAAAAAPAQPQPPEPGAPEPQPTPVPLAPPPAPEPPSAPAASAASSKVFNPDMAVIGNFVGTGGKNDIEHEPSLEMQETEASFQAIVDPYARGDIFLSFSPDGVEVEEAFATFNTLPGGLLVKAGKFRSAFGKVNTMHTHVVPWVDRPIALRNLFGGADGVADSGVSVSRLILNPLFFLEATGEVTRGASGVFQSSERSRLAWVGRLRAYRDLTEGTNLDIGTSFAYGPTDVGPETSARVVGIDATFRYRPLRRAIYRRVIARTELVWNRQDAGRGADQAFGFYASGEYQFARRWYAGARLDRSERALDSAHHDSGASLLFTYWPSEFSQLRGQYRRTRYAEDVTANEVLFQLLFSIGAHGAHVF